MIPFKVVMLGDSNVGKTCIVERFINDAYGAQANTLSANFNTKIITSTAGLKGEPVKVKLQVWDTAGSE